MSKKMKNTDSVEEIKSLSGKPEELKEAVLEGVTGGRRIVPGFVDKDIRGINNDRRHEAK